MRASIDSSLLIILANALAAKAQAQSCPEIHIFGARETSVAPGFGSAGALVDMIKADHPGATSEAIDYPACGGQASCGSVEYGASAKQGTEAVTTAVNGLNERCPDTKIVMIGYSQGGQIMDNNICGGPDNGASISDSSVPLSASAVEQVKAVIMLGNPRFINGLAYGVGTCDAGGFDARPEGFTCPNADKVQIYCDAEDPFCCNGNDSAHHQQYVDIYGKQALEFVNSKLSGTAAGGNAGNGTDAGAGNGGDANGDAGNVGGNTGNTGGSNGGNTGFPGADAGNAGNNGNAGGSFGGNFGQGGNSGNAGSAQSNGNKC
ncbi:acetylxylan esterase 2 [Fusarium sporotrichioides]|uniref:Acetylxylan esterase 2 n=1 Tax=Fusarium sporotrichioides TaxID=5514 RepID=A0A395SBD8_FUSSP|nr:acetylxylan esterase 2 [Fusarium sporotrichioides]